MNKLRPPLFWILAVLWLLAVVTLLGPLLVEWLDERGLTGRIPGLPVNVTEALLFGTLWIVGVAVLWVALTCRHKTSEGGR